MARLLAWPFEELPLAHGLVEGIPWAVRPCPASPPCVNGYAQIPAEGHPWSNLIDYDDIQPFVTAELTYGPHVATLDSDDGEPATFVQSLADVGGWVGFSTTGYNDVWAPDALAEAGLSYDGERCSGLPDTDPTAVVHWTVDKVIEQAQFLARDIAKAGHERWGRAAVNHRRRA